MLCSARAAQRGPFHICMASVILATPRGAREAREVHLVGVEAGESSGGLSKPPSGPVLVHLDVGHVSGRHSSFLSFLELENGLLTQHQVPPQAKG